ncbi:hypothetical protein CAP36_15245 [Chitinophagaceae bacterium IBVUCB2]|nr:hypothetical protein CAP36_15245 [Chitinophagaceae bacterium IBVUCB2]
MINRFLIAVLLMAANECSGQTPVDVAETTLKVNILGEEFFYLGFAAGDKLIFSFEEANGKELKEVEITEMPSTSKFIAYKTSMIKNKQINVQKTGIYKFRFTNSAGISAKICKYKIQRIPASAATQDFNTTVFTHVVNDTTYTMEEDAELTKTDTVYTNFQDRTVKVAAATPPGANKTTFNFVLNENVIAWSYYIHVNQAGQKPFDEANRQIVADSKAMINKFPNYTVMGAIAAGKPVAINKLQEGEDIAYWVMEGENEALFKSGGQFRFIKKGKAVNDFSRMEPRKGSLFFCFSNDNPTEAVSVTVKITTVQVNEAMEIKPVKRMIIKPRTEMYLKN